MEGALGFLGFTKRAASSVATSYAPSARGVPSMFGGGPPSSSPNIAVPFTPSASSPHLARRPPSPLPHYPPHCAACAGGGPSDSPLHPQHPQHPQQPQRPQRSTSADGPATGPVPKGSGILDASGTSLEVVEATG